MIKLPRQTVNEVYAERDQLKAINADLLAALESLLAARDYVAPVGISAGAKLNDVALWDQARAAITKARGKEE